MSRSMGDAESSSLKSLSRRYWDLIWLKRMSVFILTDEIFKNEDVFKILVRNCKLKDAKIACESLRKNLIRVKKQ